MLDFFSFLVHDIHDLDLPICLYIRISQSQKPNPRKTTEKKKHKHPLTIPFHCRPDIESHLLTLENTYITTTKQDRSVSPAAIAQWLQTASNEDTWAGPEMWKLRNLAVHPSYQRRGIGAQLIQWGKQQATEEKCPVVLTSSMEGQGLYLKEGFRRIGIVRMDGLGGVVGDESEV